MRKQFAIIGGGIMGSATAYFLAQKGYAKDIVVIEPDPSYAKATTPQGAGGIRQQFSLPENIAMSTFSLDFYRNFERHMLDIPDMPDIGFQQNGYMFVVGKDGEETLLRNQKLQSSMGVKTHLMDRAEMLRKFPSIERADITLSSYTPDNGWIDPHAALTGFRKAAEYMGVAYVRSSVVGMDLEANRVKSAHLDNDDTIQAETFINTAGPWVSNIAKLSGATLPIVPMCRVQHFWKCNFEFEDMPLVKDESGMFFRREGDGFAGGCPSFDIPPGFVDDIYRGFFANYFEDKIWPMLADLVPKFEEIKLQRSWGGHYAQNQLDGNMIIGQYSPNHENIITACGFSGHGIMHAPAVGRALSELALTGTFETLDLARLGYERIIKNQPYAEIGIK